MPQQPVRDPVQPGSGGWFQEVDFIEQEQAAELHGQGQRAVFKLHVPLASNAMPGQFGKLQAAVPDHLKHRVVPPGRQLFDTACFPAAGGAENIQGIGRPQEPDRNIPALGMEDVTGAMPGSERARLSKALNQLTRWGAAEDAPASKSVGVSDCKSEILLWCIGFSFC